MVNLPPVTDPAMADPSSARHYDSLIEQSALARSRGDHLTAQQFASEAHKWAMDEHTRLQRLAHARQSLAMAKQQLETVWNKDRDCTTVDELRERHPEFRRVINNWERAEQLVLDLQDQAPDGNTT